MVTTGAIGRAKFQSNHHHQQTNIQFLQAGCPSCRPTNSVKALKGKYHIPAAAEVIQSDVCKRKYKICDFSV